MEDLLQVSQDEQIDRLYSLIAKDPKFLDVDEKALFVNTPLHLAAANGCGELALEVLRLMPSYGQKLNPDGHSPLHIALREGYVKLVRDMIKLDPELIRVKGREGITPLHYVAEKDQFNLLAEFLFRSPNCIRDLTVRRETALHVAVKNVSLWACKVLVGYHRINADTHFLACRDWKGNTPLHLAAERDQNEVMEVLVLPLLPTYVARIMIPFASRARRTYIHLKNSNGLTALDIVMQRRQLPTDVNEKSQRLILSKEHIEFSPLPSDINPCARYLISPSHPFAVLAVVYAHSYMVTGETRDTILVVAVLIATATFQATLSPPGGLSSDSAPTSMSKVVHVAMSKEDYKSFAVLNSVAFGLSLSVMLIGLPHHPTSILLYLSVVCLAVTYILAIIVTSPNKLIDIPVSVILLSVLGIWLIVLMVVLGYRVGYGNRNYWIRTVDDYYCSRNEDEATHGVQHNNTTISAPQQHV